ncbi:archaeal heat shock protein Hsp14 [Candidatus Nitrososphaera gargensis]|nr:archaeal heat shock protein Hsp14 [Candidatus Nitrososphaera gargensis]
MKQLIALLEDIACMGIVEYTVRELFRELDKRTQEFYEYVMPAVDMYEDGNDLVVDVDLPGFRKEDISIRIVDGNILSIKATKKRAPPTAEEPLGPIHYRQRPVQIDKRIVLPISTRDAERVTGTAKYENGVVTLRIPIPKATVVPIT